MTHTITIAPSGRQFQAEAGETILAAGVRQGIGLPYGCKDGACGSCKCKLISGEVTLGTYQDKALSDAERAAGYVLTCCGTAQGDVTLESRQVGLAGTAPVRKMPVRVIKLERVNDDVMIVTVQLPAGEPMLWQAGQFIEFILRDGSRRSYSMANAPHTVLRAPTEGAAPVPVVELHIRHMPGGVFTDHVFGSMKEKEILRAEGPLGGFFLREESDKPLILLASGTGFAPIKAIIEHMQHQGISRPAVLYWGGRRPRDLYMDAWMRAQAETMPHLRYVPVVSEATADDDWQGRTGFVHRAVLQDWPDLSGHQVYACGSPIVIASARADFTTLAGLPDFEFFADAFTSAADKN